MTITAQSGIVGFGLQTGKGSLATTWYRMKALSTSLGPITQKQIAPPEIDGNNNPTGAYKSGSFYAGKTTVLPRLEDDFGNLLLGLTGYAAAPVDNGDGTYTHVFSQAPVASGGAIFLPWMSFRRYIPGVDLTTDVGDIGLDCKISSGQFTLPQVGPLAVDFDVTGRVPTLDAAPDLWTWSGIAEAFKSVPMSMTGSFKLPSFDTNPLPATGVRVTVLNNTTTVQEERIVGSYNPDDFATRQRVLQIEFTYKWRDPALYRFIYNGGDVSNGDFAPCLETTDLEITTEAPCDINPGTVDVPYKLVIKAPNVDWREAGSVTLAGDEIIQQSYTGIALEAASGNPEDYFQFELTNERSTQYAIPT
ncbi:MAG: hypothetical protein DSY80_07805 [Desulfocapsa sp.]|nr:MAG: hypothetical protein DSY80_07805 [Desulfocapsa sp.]